MTRHLHTTVESFPIAGSFTISRGAKTSADVVTCIIEEGSFVGRGECVPYRRYGESLDSVVAQIAEIKAAIEDGLSRHDLQKRIPKQNRSKPPTQFHLDHRIQWPLRPETGRTERF